MHAQLNQFIDSLKAICKTAQHTLRREFGRITASLKAIYKTAQHTLRREFGRITASLKAIYKTAQHTLRREFSRITASLKAICKTAQHTLRREFSRITASLKAICKTAQHTLRRELGRITASLKVIYKTAQHTLRQNVGLMVEQLERKWPELEQRCQRYTVLIRLDRPIGILLLLWPALWGLWIAAAGMPDWHVFIVFCTGVVLMRSAGCVLNDIADRDFDQHVARTKNRPLASGSISAREALVFAITIILIAFLLVLTLNRLTIQLSFIAIGLAAIYPFMKRYTYLPQFFLGLAFGWSIPMAFAAQTGNVPRVAWVLLIANVLWSVVYDTMYAMVDREDDLKIGVKSTAILFDDADRIIISIIQLLVMSALLLVGKQLEMGMFYYLGLFIASGFFLYQIRLIWNREPENCLKAFKNNNWFGMTVFIGIMLNFLFIES